LLGSQDIVAFIATKKAERSREFYETVLGLRLVSDEPFALVFDANGTMLRVSKMNDLTPARYTVLGWRVSNIRRTVGALQEKGVTFERYPGLAQDDFGVCTFPGGSRVAWFKDPDGNVLSLTEFVSDA
jgi:catechol 2,3-dioxygenase-like lactoylglutathione lyase family enzyme